MNFRDPNLQFALQGKILPALASSRGVIAYLLEILKAIECTPTPTPPAAAPAEPPANVPSAGYRCRPYLDLGGAMHAIEVVESKRLVRRDCYDHIWPLIFDKMKTDKRVALKGTPGIGKSVFGFFALRELILNNRDCHTVVYWDKQNVTMFSTDTHYTEKFGLNMRADIGGVHWSIGMWEPNERALLSEVLMPEDIYVIHDPAEGFLDGGLRRTANRLLVIVSFGHALLGKWYTKGGHPRFSLTMPFFSEDEIMANKANLFFQKTDMVWDEQRVKHNYSRFGGSIRHWGMRNEEEAWDELKAKVREVARTDGSNIIERTTNHKESIVHLDVDFDIAKPLYPAEDHNLFDDGRQYILASTGIAREFAAALKDLGSAELRRFMGAIKGGRGAEGLYGLLFELFAHDFLRHVKGDVNIRVVRKDGKNKNQYATVKLPVGDNLLIFPSAEARGIAEAADNAKLKVGTYIQPESGSFPTFDAAVVVPGRIVGLKEKFVGLLLQMTVSGATGLRRKPKHVVRQYMRKDMHTALEATIEGFSGNCISVTTFCVPAACFHPFLFQMETNKDSDQEIPSNRQPDFQFVIEIPDGLRLKATKTPVGEIHGASGRTHRYLFRHDKPKRVKVQRIQETEDD